MVRVRLACSAQRGTSSGIGWTETIAYMTERALDCWYRFLNSTEELEPGNEAIQLATAFEEAAMEAGLPFDVGESLLCAAGIVLAVEHVITGDKRAIETLEGLLPIFDRLQVLRGRIVCFEQLVQALVKRLGETRTRTAVCAEPDADRAISLCFQCGRREGRLDAEGLPSCINYLRTRAPTMLARSSPI